MQQCLLHLLQNCVIEFWWKLSDFRLNTGDFFYPTCRFVFCRHGLKLAVCQVETRLQRAQHVGGNQGAKAFLQELQGECFA